MVEWMELRSASKIYGRDETQVRALDSVSLRIGKGEFVSVIGQSGSGKSTLMNILGCLDSPTKGAYLLSGRDTRTLSDRELSDIRNRQIGFIFQGFNLIPSLSALENVELPLVYRGVERRERRRMAAEALEQVGLSGRMHHRPGEMSGGQQQRVAIARAIAARPPIIMADEPTGNLDSASGRQVMDAICGLSRSGRTVILITHDPGVAAAASRLICVGDGKILSDTGA